MAHAELNGTCHFLEVCNIGKLHKTFFYKHIYLMSVLFSCTELLFADININDFQVNKFSSLKLKLHMYSLDRNQAKKKVSGVFLKCD